MTTDFMGRRHFVGAVASLVGCASTTTNSRREPSMNEQRIDPYTWPHKMLRRLLFDATARAGSVDAEDPSDMRELSSVLSRTFDVVDAHAQHEETFLHPLIATRFPELERSLRAEHARTHAELGLLRRLLDTAVDAEAHGERARLSLEFYRGLGRFTAEYLEHLDEEERSLPALWSGLSSDELGDAMRRFHASRTPDQALADFEHMLPALAPAEREQLLTSIRSTAPPAGFQRACKVARRVLDRDAWERIRACVSVP